MGEEAHRPGRLRALQRLLPGRRGRTRSAGIFDGKRLAEKEARRAEGRIEAGEWIDPADGKLTFQRYVEDYWWPSRQLEATTRAAYRSYLDKHFLPCFDKRAMASITTTSVETWIAKALKGGPVGGVGAQVPLDAQDGLPAGGP